MSQELHLQNLGVGEDVGRALLESPHFQDVRHLYLNCGNTISEPVKRALRRRFRTRISV